MIDADLDLIINDINAALLANRPLKLELIKSGIEVTDLEKKIRLVQSKFIILRDQSHENNGWEFKDVSKIDREASKVESIIDNYNRFLEEGHKSGNWKVTINGLIKNVSLAYDVIRNIDFKECSRLVEIDSQTESRLADYENHLDHLPGHVRRLILFGALLPKGHHIKRKWIIGIWIAEGFVVPSGNSNKSLEELAGDYINELVECSQVEVIEKDIFERVKVFKFTVSDRAREWARRKYFGIISDGLNISEIADGIRRVFVEKCDGTLEFGKDIGRFKSFYLFAKDTSLSCKGKNKAVPDDNHLRVLCLRSEKIDAVPDNVFEFDNLQCLELASKKKKSIGKSVRKLKKLQTLDLRHANVTSLPIEVQYLEQLRHLYVARIKPLVFTSMKMDEKCDLKELQTLKKIKFDSRLVKHLPKLVKLNNLFITEVKCSSAEKLWVSLSKIKCLNTLGVVTENSKKILSLENIKLENMEKFYLKGRLAEIKPTTFVHLGKLKVFHMVMSELARDPLISLSKMSGLVKLYLDKAYCGGKLTFCNGWFPNLKYLHLCRMPLLSEIVIQNGTMVDLKCLQFSFLPQLNVPTNLDYLHNLDEISVLKMPEMFKQTLNLNYGTSTKIIILEDSTTKLEEIQP